MPPYLQGLGIGLAYVAPIGMQNLFVINSALTQPRRKALLTALIVIFFDISLALACFFGIGALMSRFAWLQMVILLVGGSSALSLPFRHSAGNEIFMTDSFPVGTALSAFMIG